MDFQRGPSARRLARWPFSPARAAALALAIAALGAGAQEAAKPPVSNSNLDEPLFFQLLVGELEAAEGRREQGVEIMLDAARRTRDEAVFRRAAEMAVQARAGDQALAATKAWRATFPQSREAVQLQLQVLFALGKATESAEPLRSLIDSTPVEDRSVVISALPRLLASVNDKAAAVTIAEDVLRPYQEPAATRVAAKVALARVLLAAGNEARALELTRAAALDDPAAPGPALLAVELMPNNPSAEAIVQSYLSRSEADAAVRLVYSRALTGAQRLDDAAQQLRLVVAQKPDMGSAWLGLAAHAIELKHLDEAERALMRYLEIAAAQPQPAEPRRPEGADADDEENASHDPVQAWMMLSQVAEMKGDLPGAQAWIDKIQPDDVDMAVISRKAGLLAKQGRLQEARTLITGAPEREKGDARAKLIAEAELLRDVKKLPQAYEVLAKASQQFPDDVSLIYEQAMMAEKLDRVADMERLLRRVIQLDPEHAHAHNALGYSLADRNLRLDEARALIERALALSPGDPFIVDSLGWVEFRMGRFDAAIALLRKAYASRSDTEIAAHLGEVLWASGNRDEARRVWLAARARDADNEVLKQTIARLKAGL